ncbi:MAG: methionine--tRNA ligase, partial [Ignavibacteria bacterium]|nr:methionine--tRNA ligase [Ignavibacteria bacterium]
MKRTLITSALPYANGYLHLGHCAGAYLPADIYARFKRLKGEEVLYVCGSDEHGVAITIAADKEGVSPQEIIDKYHYANKESFDKFGMSFDIYSRTSLPVHHNTAREFFSDFKEKGFLIDMEEEQFYDNDAGMFLPDRYVEGVCPNCGNDHARGDQCDSCGAYYNQLELKNPVSLVSGKTPVVRRTVHWYMRFDKFQNFLENYIESHAGDWKDNVLQQSRSWLKQGLAERAITRDLTWGVKIDDLPDIPPEKAQGKVLYVWFEAVLGYISATKELMGILNKEGKAGPEDWRKWWQDDETRHIAFIGKDNIVFHTLIFPAILHGRGNNYILPDNVPANEFLNLEGQKFSKSRNWSIDLRDFISDFPNPSSIDALRYTLAMSLPETKDSDFTWKDFQARNNNELSAIFGNFVNRTLQFALKNFDGIPELPDKYKWLNLYWKNLVHYF